MDLKSYIVNFHVMEEQNYLLYLVRIVTRACPGLAPLSVAQGGLSLCYLGCTALCVSAYTVGLCRQCPAGGEACQLQHQAKPL